MTADPILRRDLLEYLQHGNPFVREYRAHHVSKQSLSPASLSVISVDSMDLTTTAPYDSVTDLLAIIRDIDYLIDVLDTVNEPAMKGL